MIIRTLLCIAILIAIGVGQVRADDAAPGPAADVPELKLLSQFAGHWDSELGVNAPGETTGAKTTGKTECQWILDGRFLRQSWSIQPAKGIPAMKGQSIRTYDPQKKKFVAWTFHSSGYTETATGEWDEKAKAFNWMADLPQYQWTTETRSAFPKEGYEEWSIVTKNRQGKVIIDLKGKAMRRTE